MKIKVKEMNYESVAALPLPPHVKPKKPNRVLSALIRAFSASELKKVNFTSEKVGMDKLSKDEPCLYLMNHSSFIDLEIASYLIYPKPYTIITTQDGFVGKEGLMRSIGCIPTRKFVTDLTLVRDMVYTVKDLKTSVLMYPEASYSFDGTATALPDSLGKCVKLLGVPVVMIRTYGAFLRDPLYNNLQLRKVDVSAKMEYLISKEEVKSLSVDEINAILNKKFTFDNFKIQQENKIKVTEPFRADCLNRVLYKCPHCLSEGNMLGKGTEITCKKCGKTYELDEYGYLRALDGDSKFNHIPDWYKWERECVKEEIISGNYELKSDVDIYMLVDFKQIYKVGDGTLIHNEDGFKLTGCNGKLEYTQKPTASYSLYSDYYWYELGDMICIGDAKQTYYCFPKGQGDIVAKARLAAEELFKLKFKAKQKNNKR